MEYNLLLKKYDYYCDLFISGFIDFKLLTEIEKEHEKRRELFTIYLN